MRFINYVIKNNVKKLLEYNYKSIGRTLITGLFFFLHKKYLQKTELLQFE